MNISHSYIIILLALFLGFNASAQNFTLKTQAEVDAFDQSISDITGNLIIQTALGNLDEITNVNALSI